jgi:hypothetical protein
MLSAEVTVDPIGSPLIDKPYSLPDPANNDLVIVSIVVANRTAYRTRDFVLLWNDGQADGDSLCVGMEDHLWFVASAGAAISTQARGAGAPAWGRTLQADSRHRGMVFGSGEQFSRFLFVVPKRVRQVSCAFVTGSPAAPFGSNARLAVTDVIAAGGGAPF